MSAFTAPEANPVSSFPTAEKIRRLFEELPSQLQAYLGFQFSVGLELLSELHKHMEDADSQSYSSLMLDHEQIGHLFELSSLFADAGTAFCAEEMREEDLKVLRRLADEAFYPEGFAAVEAGDLAYGLGELEGAISDVLSAEHLFVSVGEEDNICNLLPNLPGEKRARFGLALREMRRLLEYVTFCGGTDEEPDFSERSFDEQEDDEEDEQLVPATLRDMTAAMRKLSRSTRSQFAWLHNKLCSIALAEVGGRVADLAPELRSGGADEEEEQAIVSQFREAILARTVFRKDAKGFDWDAVEPEDAISVYDNLLNALSKRTGDPLRRALILLTAGLSFLRRMDPESLRDTMAGDDNVPYEDWLALCGAAEIYDVVSSDGSRKVTLNLGAVDPRTVKIHGFKPENVWTEFSSRLSCEDAHRLAHYMKNLILLYDEVADCAPARAWLENDWLKHAGESFVKTDEYVKPVRALLLSAVISVTANGSDFGSKPAPLHFIPGSSALFSRFGGEVVRALEEWAEEDEDSAGLIASSLSFLGTFGVKCFAMISEIGDQLPSGVSAQIGFGPVMFAAQAMAFVSGTLCMHSEQFEEAAS